MDHSWCMRTGDAARVLDFLDELSDYSARRYPEYFRWRVENVTGQVFMPARRPKLARAFAAKDGDLIVLLALIEENPNDYRLNTVHLVTDPYFPLSGAAVLDEWRKWFPDALPMPGGCNTGLLMFLNGEFPSPRYGAPILPCNIWLQDSLAAGEEPEDLYKAWLRRYRQDRGYAPADEERSFRAAVAGSRRRIGKRVST